MSSVVYLKAVSDPSYAPCLVLIDMQREYTTDARMMATPEAATGVSNCRAALSHARSLRLPIALVRQVSQSAFFNPATVFAKWIDGFEPRSSDMIFERSKPSCYSSKPFSELMDSCGGNFVFAGFAGETACLSTAIDAYHRGHTFTYLADASASHGLRSVSARNVQTAVSEIVGVYGNVLDTNSWIKQTSSTLLVSNE